MLTHDFGVGPIETGLLIGLYLAPLAFSDSRGFWVVGRRAGAAGVLLNDEYAFCCHRSQHEARSLAPFAVRGPGRQEL